jgi:hypothetical protein
MQQNNGRPLDTLHPSESRVVWVCDVSGIPYVRESVIESRRRRGKPGCRRSDSVIVGYSEIAPEVEAERHATGRRHFFFRRVFWLAAHDRVNEPEGVYATSTAMEAVAMPTT